MKWQWMSVIMSQPRDLAPGVAVLTSGADITMLCRPDQGVSSWRAQMHGLRSALVAVCLIGIVGSGVALAQTTPPTPPAPGTSMTDDASKWTRKQWSAMVAKWSQEKAKWKDCRKQSRDQKLAGRKSWGFLASCMNKST
jgi:hypothetical protein